MGKKVEVYNDTAIGYAADGTEIVRIKVEPNMGKRRKTNGHVLKPNYAINLKVDKGREFII
jgi:hypothetical protein